MCLLRQPAATLPSAWGSLALTAGGKEKRKEGKKRKEKVNLLSPLNTAATHTNLLRWTRAGSRALLQLLLLLLLLLILHIHNEKSMHVNIFWLYKNPQVDFSMIPQQHRTVLNPIRDALTTNDESVNGRSARRGTSCTGKKDFSKKKKKSISLLKFVCVCVCVCVHVCAFIVKVYVCMCVCVFPLNFRKHTWLTGLSSYSKNSTKHESCAGSIGEGYTALR